MFSLGIVVLAVAFAAVRFGPPRTKMQATNLYLFATGDVVGCSVDDVLSPLDADLYEAGAAIMNDVRPIESDGALVKTTSPAGEFWTPANNDALTLLAERAVDVYAVGDAPVRQGDVVMDLGANVGFFSRRAFEAGASMVIAVEPSPLNIESLKRNFAEEIAAETFILVPKAVWNEPGTMMLKLYDLSVLDSLVMEHRDEAAASSEVPVELVTIDSIIEELALDRLDFIKMDIEGAEREALQGAPETLRRFRPRMAIAAENLPDDVEVVPSVVRSIVPDYQVHNGRCRAIAKGVLRPEVLEFLPGAETAQAAR
ncbi:MAG: FkbM family methyltransferase [Acidobacteria bacterium]|nr:FkbM family methyltransferase [Acidobacteriota bacterium]